jgi:UDP-glucose 4-epimerase
MRILITGAFGFIGGRLVQYLNQEGHNEVVLCTRRVKQYSQWLPYADVRQIDWDSQRDLVDLCSEVEVIVHAAGMNAQECSVDPVSALIVNGVNTSRIVEAALKTGVKRIIYLSTAHVYASPLSGILNEEISPKNLDPYATSHLAGENSVLYAGKFHNLEGIVLRLSNTFGAPIHKNVNCWMLLVNDLCKQVAESSELVLNSRGFQQLDFMSMTNLCKVIGFFIFSENKYDPPTVFNVGSGKSHSVMDLTRLIQKRAENLLGALPAIKYPDSVGLENHDKLLFQTNKLKQNSIKLDTNYSQEIDDLLQFCFKNFIVK